MDLSKLKINERLFRAQERCEPSSEKSHKITGTEIGIERINRIESSHLVEPGNTRARTADHAPDSKSDQVREVSAGDSNAGVGAIKKAQLQSGFRIKCVVRGEERRRKMDGWEERSNERSFSEHPLLHSIDCSLPIHQLLQLFTRLHSSPLVSNNRTLLLSA